MKKKLYSNFQYLKSVSNNGENIKYLNYWVHTIFKLVALLDMAHFLSYKIQQKMVYYFIVKIRMFLKKMVIV